MKKMIAIAAISLCGCTSMYHAEGTPTDSLYSSKMSCAWGQVGVGSGVAMAAALPFGALGGMLIGASEGSDSMKENQDRIDGCLAAKGWVK